MTSATLGFVVFDLQSTFLRVHCISFLLTSSYGKLQLCKKKNIIRRTNAFFCISFRENITEVSQNKNEDVEKEVMWECILYSCCILQPNFIKYVKCDLWNSFFKINIYRENSDNAIFIIGKTILRKGCIKIFKQFHMSWSLFSCLKIDFFQPYF